MIRHVLIFSLSLGTASWSAAQTPVQPKSPSPAPSPTAASNKVDSTSVASLGSQYVYDPTGKKDPFKPYRAPRTRGDNRPAAPLDPLTQLEVSALQLVAIMWNTSKPRAVVKDGQGRIFTIFKNNRVGRNDGVVVDIREGEVVIVEKFDDGLGNVIKEPRVLEMKVKPDSNATAAAGG